MTRIIGRRDPGLTARILRSVPLLYGDGADEAMDRPTHVRAASGVACVNGHVAIVQDDASFVALANPATGRARAIVLPAGEGGVRQFDDLRGNKRYKLDLESCVAVDAGAGGEMLIGFGSGSTSARERIVVVRGIGTEDEAVEVIDASPLYRRLRETVDFAGSEMNIEGAAILGGTLRLFNRGNGAAVGDLVPVDASCDLDLSAFLAFLRAPSTARVPEPRGVVQYALGELDGVPLTFTDAASRGTSILFAAAAEDSPDTYHDGVVIGSAIGIIEGGEARWTPILDVDGSPYAGKVEGIVPHPSSLDRLLAVIDRDDPRVPSHLLEIDFS